MARRLLKIGWFLSVLLSASLTALWPRSYAATTVVLNNYHWGSFGVGTLKGRIALLASWASDFSDRSSLLTTFPQEDFSTTWMDGDVHLRAMGFGWVTNTIYGPPMFQLIVPFWFIVSVAWLVTLRFSLAIHYRRHEAGLCRQCGYDLRATPNRCPECGYRLRAGVASG